MNTWTLIGPGVYRATGGVDAVAGADIALLKETASRLPQRRCRICMHTDPADPVQEMIIALHRDSYVRPHCHLDKAESLHVIEGTADLVLFTMDGAVSARLPLGNPRDGKTGYCRVPAGVFHTLLLETEWLVFHEVLRGPFDPATTGFPTWAPDGLDTAQAAAYSRGLSSAPAAAT